MSGGRAVRDALAEALPTEVVQLFHGPQEYPTWEERLATAERLLPVVEAECRRRAAEELRAAAEAIDDDARVGEARRLGQAQRAVGEARSVVLERADAIEAMAAERPAMRHSDGTLCRISLGHTYCAICGRNA